MSPFQTTPVGKVSNFVDFYAETKACLKPTERQLITNIEDELMCLDSITSEALVMWQHIIRRLCTVARTQGIPIPMEFPHVENGMTTEASLDWYYTEIS